MSQHIFLNSNWKEIVDKFNIPEEFVLPTERYFKSHEKNKPNLRKKFFKKALNAKAIRKLDSFSLSPQTKFNVKYNYVKLKKNEGFIRWDKLTQRERKEEKIYAAKNWRTDLIEKPKLNVNLHTPEGIRIRMHIRGDGGIDKNARVFYFNNERNLLEEFIKDAISLFGKCRYSIVDDRKKVYLSKTVSRIFTDNLGYRLGREIAHDIGIDKDIINAKRELKSHAIRSYFDDEARFHSNSIEVVRSKDMSYIDRNKLKKIISNPRKYYHFAPKVLLDLREMLKDFQIKTSLPYFYKGDLLVTVDPYNNLRLSVGWRFRITSEENIKKYQQEIGFNHNKKRKLIEDYLKNIKVHKSERNKAWELALIKCKELEKKEKPISIKNLSFVSERSEKQTRRWIKTLEKKNLIELAKGRDVKQGLDGRFVGGSEYFEYKLKK
ncbi:MAG: hypothetical protein JSV92_02450 [archaeon]|nr:MAG: hypothetical protein JSV92_02450 [archaeon]